ncbi:sugar phosphate isomerase/epimerase family protein [Cerasicoccus arenae]|uniref:Sugar phosphate isomerase n=1 Tax=Cerasicoccus arenae TaxID=424488 RepID=A0A8J3DC09_9BACT|nr:sugar phosphate isomerase/epimerase [Cerasicoccus arenae]MBK1857405.1 sugar phosphate isomerase/epimerase [Cerasicoccus arenae]GHC07926.1 sugar phosphate isomerase [Cerasicoccus arenae]
MKIHQVAAQLFTLREFTKTPEDIAQALKKVAEIGYQAVQVSGFGPIENSEVVRLCAENGLTIAATHESGEVIRKEPAKAVQKLKELGCIYTAYPFPAGVDFESEQSVNELIADLENACKVFTEAGMVLTYHNHAVEFLRMGKTTILDKIYSECSIQAELDTYWVQAGGCNPEAWVRKLKGRSPLIHLKDFKMTGHHEHTFAEIGYGNLDFKGIIAAADEAGCQWFMVEQDVCPGDPFDSLKMSFDYIKENLVEA